MSKYSFNYIDLDTSELVYKDKKFTITKDVELQKEIQSVNKKARLLMRMDLAKQGLTDKDLIIVRKEGNKTFEDKTHLVELEKEYTNEASVELFESLSQKYFGMDLGHLILDIGLTNEEADKFGADFAKALAGQTSPREETK